MKSESWCEKGIPGKRLSTSKGGEQGKPGFLKQAEELPVATKTHFIEQFFGREKKQERLKSFKMVNNKAVFPPLL